MPDNFTHQEELELKLTGLKNRKTSKQVVVFVKDSSNMDHFVRYRGFQGRTYSRMLHGGGGAYSTLPEKWDKMATDMRTLTKHGDQILL